MLAEARRAITKAHFMMTEALEEDVAFVEKICLPLVGDAFEGRFCAKTYVCAAETSTCQTSVRSAWQLSESRIWNVNG